jgi:transcriptional regulator with XRE-family HTH domain
MAAQTNQPHHGQPTVVAQPGDLGDWIRRERQQRHFSQRELASRASLSRSYLCDIERGRGASPSIATLDRLATALGVSRTEMLQVAGIVDPPAGHTTPERRMMALYRDLSTTGQSSVERYIRFLYEEEHRFVQPPLIESGEDEEAQRSGPTLFDLTPLR